jgi:hypothetical protein
MHCFLSPPVWSSFELLLPSNPPQPSSLVLPSCSAQFPRRPLLSLSQAFRALSHPFHLSRTRTCCPAPSAASVVGRSCSHSDRARLDDSSSSSIVRLGATVPTPPRAFPIERARYQPVERSSLNVPKGVRHIPNRNEHPPTPTNQSPDPCSFPRAQSAQSWVVSISATQARISAGEGRG